MPARLRLGLIGCGSQGRFLCEAVNVAGGAEFVACADVVPEAVERAVSQFGFARRYLDYHALLAEQSLDAVIVATTHDALAPAALAALAAGCHVFCEKPAGLTAADGRALLAAARAAGRRLMVGYALRFKPDRLRLKQLLDEGAVGEVVHVTAGQLIGDLGGWLADPARGGGPLLYVGSHALDQVLWVVGRPVERVYAVVDQPAGQVERDAAVTLTFSGGVTAQVLTSSKLGGRYGWLDVLGSRGRLRSEWESHRLTVESQVVPEYRHLTHLDVPVDAYLPELERWCPATVVSGFYIRMWAAEMVEFQAAIAEGRDPVPSGVDGLRLLEVTDAIRESARTGAAVGVSGADG